MLGAPRRGCGVLGTLWGTGYFWYLVGGWSVLATFSRSRGVLGTLWSGWGVLGTLWSDWGVLSTL